MSNHAAYGLPIESLDVLVIEDSKAMQILMRGMLNAMGVRRVRLYDDGQTALAAAIAEPPNVILTDCHMEPMNGLEFLNAIRRQKMAALRHVPVLFVTAHGTISMVQKAALAGAQHVVVKPVSPNALYARLRWLTTDEREMVVAPNGQVVIQGVRETISAQLERRRRLYHGRVLNKLKEGSTQAVTQSGRGVPNDVIVSDQNTGTDVNEPRQAFAPSKAAFRPRQRRAKSKNRGSLGRI